VVLITHRPPLLALVKRIILIDKGKVAMDGPRDEVMKQLTRPNTKAA
jgi:ATP-binding cassette subfamily C protein LapB